MSSVKINKGDLLLCINTVGLPNPTAAWRKTYNIKEGRYYVAESALNSDFLGKSFLRTEGDYRKPRHPYRQSRFQKLNLIPKV